MFAVTHTTPKRALSHLRRLEREGDAMLSSKDLLTPSDPCYWEARVVKYLRRITADCRALDEVLFGDMPALSAEDFRSLPPKPTQLVFQ